MSSTVTSGTTGRLKITVITLSVSTETVSGAGSTSDTSR